MFIRSDDPLTLMDPCLVNTTNGEDAAAAIIRNDKGEAIAGSARPLGKLLDSTMAEAHALRLGLQLLEEIACSPAIVESDNLELVNACDGKIELWSPYTTILSDCCQIEYKIGNISFQHCPEK